MRLHRFFVDPSIHPLIQKMWLRNEALVNQWERVLRFRPGQELILFDGQQDDKLYRLLEFNDGAAHLEHITDMARKLPQKDIYLAWALLKKDKNDWVLQKCTELGVNHFIPLLTDRCEKTGFNEERAKKIITEAAEQCGRSNLPNVREPIQLETLIDEFTGKVPILACEQEGSEKLDTTLEQAVLIVGPEGGWTEAEVELFKNKKVALINIGDFTHRAETASIAAVSKLV